MRRRWTAVAAGCAAVMLLGGCMTPGDVDGDLTDDWAALGEPKIFVPDAGTCHPRFQEIGMLSVYQPVDCGEPHEVETVHVGTFSGKAANRTRPPTGSQLSDAWKECNEKAAGVLGADWRTARLSLAIVPPSDNAWSGGARWFRCDVSEVKSLDDDTITPHTGSLKGTLRSSSPLSLGCFNPKVSDSRIDRMAPVACNKPHHSEFAGIYDVKNMSYSQFISSDEQIHKKCLSVIADFAGVPNNADMKYRTGTIFYYPGRTEWDSGNHGVQCFLWSDDQSLKKSAKGAGKTLLPVR